MTRAWLTQRALAWAAATATRWKSLAPTAPMEAAMTSLSAAKAV